MRHFFRIPITHNNNCYNNSNKIIQYEYINILLIKVFPQHICIRNIPDVAKPNILVVEWIGVLVSWLVAFDTVFTYQENRFVFSEYFSQLIQPLSVDERI